MKNQYFGDVNDYLKYGLLRCFANAGLRIGVCWMMTPDDDRADGRKIEYLLDPSRWRSHDPLLFDSLGKVIRNGRRRDVRQIQKSSVLSNTRFFNEVVPDDQLLREKWLTKALTNLSDVDLLFFDPDNGIEVHSKPSGRTGSCKYLYWDEIRRAWSYGSSLLIFQHFPRENHERYISRLVSELSKHVPGGRVVPLVTSNVVYLLAYKACHEFKVGMALQKTFDGWGDQIQRG